MIKEVFTKGLVFGIIMLFIGASAVPFVGSRTADITSNAGVTVFSNWPCDPDIIVPDDYPTIQEAVDAANPGFCIGIRAGTYHENIVIDKENITLYGEDKNTTIIDSGGNDHVLNLRGDSCNLTCLQFRNSGKEFFGICISDSYNNIIYNNLIRDNDGGIYLNFSDSNTISSNLIFENDIFGIRLLYSLENTIHYNEVFNNTDGIIIFGSPFTKICFNKIDDNKNFGIEVDHLSNYINISKNIINNNFVGIGCEGWLHVSNSTSKSIFSMNIINNNGAGIYLDGASENIISNNNISGSCGGGFLIQGDGIYLSDSIGNLVSGNRLLYNIYGLTLEDSCQNNVITKNLVFGSNIIGISTRSQCKDNTIKNNDFINKNNSIHAIFVDSFDNSWNGNYWDNWHSRLPKPIFGFKGGFSLIKIPLLKFDWSPLSEPINYILGD